MIPRLEESELGAAAAGAGAAVAAGGVAGAVCCAYATTEAIQMVGPASSAVTGCRRGGAYGMVAPPNGGSLALTSSESRGRRTWDSGPMGTETAALQGSIRHPVTIALRNWLKRIEVWTA